VTLRVQNFKNYFRTPEIYALICIWLKQLMSPLTQSTLENLNKNAIQCICINSWINIGNFALTSMWHGLKLALTISRRICSILANINRDPMIVKMVSNTWYCSSKASMKISLKTHAWSQKKFMKLNRQYLRLHPEENGIILSHHFFTRLFFGHLFAKEFSTCWPQTIVCETLYCW
jgi:hypothetical protein